MRIALLIVCVLSSALRADEATAARKVLDKAIEALGGTKEIARHKGLTGNSKGSITLNGAKSALANVWTVQGVDQLKWSADFTLNDKSTTILLVVNSKEGWVSGNGGKANAMPKELLTAFRHGFTGLRLAETLVPLTDKDVKLSALGELKFNDKPALGIQAKRKGLPELTLWFDKATMLPIKAEMRITETSGTEVAYTAWFSEYKKIGGRKHFTKMKVQRDDDVVLDVERREIEAKEKLDDATFEKP